MNDALHNKVVKWFYDHEELLIAIMNKTPYQSDGWDYEIEVVKEFLAQPEQEPWGACLSGRVFVGKLPEHVRKLAEDNGLTIQWLYTTPPQRTWVGLTPQERDEINEQVYGAVPHHVAFHHAIEAKLRSKNGY